MQPTSLQATASTLLSQLMSGAGAGGALPEGEGESGFLGALAGQLKELLVEMGEAPDEVAALDGQALVAQFLSLMQGQTLNPSLGQGWGDEAASTAALTSAATTTEISEGPTELLSRLLSSMAADTQVSAQSAASLTDSGGLDAVSAQSNPSAWLRQLLQTSAASQSGAGAADSGDARSESSLDSIPEDFLRQILQAAAGDGGEASLAGAELDLADERLGQSSLQSGASASTLLWRFVKDPSTTAAGGCDPADSSLALGETPQSLADAAQAQADAEGAAALSGLTASGAVSAAEGATTAQRAQTLDLARLLQPGGQTALAEQIKWSMQNGITSAEIKLHPPSLGALDVRITIEGDQTSVHFVSGHPIVREVLEASMPRLRDALAQDGISLASLSVSDQAPQGRGDSGREADRTLFQGQDSETAAAETAEESTLIDSTLSVLARRHDYFV